jgi:N-acetylmuramic acid 6-phosphate etherase
MKNTITTETLPTPDQYIDLLDNNIALSLMLSNQSEAIEAVRQSLPSIEKAVSEIFNTLSNNKKSRIIYVGAGTSARIAVQDGVELYPTFNWPKKRISYIIAGGDKALTRSIEGAEDLENEKVEYLVKSKIRDIDVVIGLAASGSTKFTVKIIKLAKSLGALTIGVSNNENSILEKASNIPILLNTGMEIVAGSTRLKAGTAQKICLNLISTLVMTRLGNVKNGMMNNLVVTNAKLKNRRKLINQKLNSI